MMEHLMHFTLLWVALFGLGLMVKVVREGIPALTDRFARDLALENKVFLDKHLRSMGREHERIYAERAAKGLSKYG